MSMRMCFINLYHVQNILCKGHHSISNILWVITFWNVGLGKLGLEGFLHIFVVLIMELYCNTINFNDIRFNFRALLNIFLHFGMDKLYQRGIFTLIKIKIKNYFVTFPLCSEFCLATLAGFSHRRSHFMRDTYSIYFSVGLMKRKKHKGDEGKEKERRGSRHQSGPNGSASGMRRWITRNTYPSKIKLRPSQGAEKWLSGKWGFGYRGCVQESHRRRVVGADNLGDIRGYVVASQIWKRGWVVDIIE
jgi:hypothetical protein